MLRLSQATSDAELDQARALFVEYAGWLGLDLCFQNFAEELAHLPGKYAPPEGRLFLAREVQEECERIAGCVALRKLEAETCEMKRLYVRPEFRGKGLGRLLTRAVIEEARRIGYRRILLDTLPVKMGQAAELYRSMGFRVVEPYYHNPVEGATFMELLLD